ncbi:unnamed protein product [Prorocentrum cordatum]|uniref:Uncharacterized protein n=1 Tax=Prorocentrum cordatum TaxID=2364126 RepID=A0ABN9U1N5_9DINO|nr:unnamed protein product [Polarella glacialis]
MAHPPGAGQPWRPSSEPSGRSPGYVRFDARPEWFLAGSGLLAPGAHAAPPDGPMSAPAAGTPRPTKRGSEAIGVEAEPPAFAPKVKRVLQPTSKRVARPAAAAPLSVTDAALAAVPGASERSRRPAAANVPSPKAATRIARRQVVDAAGPSLMISDLAQVEARSVSDETRKSDKSRAHAFAKFELYALQAGHRREALDNHDTLDQVAAEYINDEIYLKGADASAPRVLTCAIIFAKSLAKGSLPRSRRAIKGFLKDEPPTSEDPCPVEAAAILAEDLFERGDPIAVESGLAFSMQFDAFLRPGEALKLKKEDAVLPSAAGHKETCVIAAQQAQKGQAPTRTAKSGEHDDTAVAGLPGLGLSFVPTVLQHLHKPTKKGELLFESLSLARYEMELKAAVARCRLDRLGITPRSARRGGPSTAANRNLLSLGEIKKRGRWLTSKSVARYEKKGKLLRQISLTGARDVALGAALLEVKRGSTASTIGSHAVRMAANIVRIRRGQPLRD